MSGKEVKKICSVTSSNLLKWKLCSKEGKLILESITGKLYKESSEEVENQIKEEAFDEETQKNCQTLREILVKMRNIVEEMENVEDKCLGLSQLCDMSSASFNKQSSNTSSSVVRASSNTSSSVLSTSSSAKSEQSSSCIEMDSSVIYTDDLSQWTQNILECHKQQLRMNEMVAQSICHVKSREEALFLVSVWVCQPSVNTQYEAAVFAIEQTLKQSSS